MKTWFRDLVRDLRYIVHHAWLVMIGRNDPQPPPDHMLVTWTALIGCTVLFVVLIIVSRSTGLFVIPPVLEDRSEIVNQALTEPVREEPRRFKPNTYMPRKRESVASGSVDPKAFFPKYDLVRIDDERAWWESDHDRGDTEDDHVMHRSLEEPLRRLIELCEKRGAKLKIQDTYRPEGIHALRSLHREGRAVDVTSDDISLEQLAKVCWAAGFDWVYFEAPKRGGAHIHCSVRADR